MGDSAPPLRDPWALSESARRRLVTVARQQHLPKGWLAERRSGGHYKLPPNACADAPNRAALAKEAKAAAASS